MHYSAVATACMTRSHHSACFDRLAFHSFSGIMACRFLCCAQRLAALLGTIALAFVLPLVAADGGRGGGLPLPTRKSCTISVGSRQFPFDACTDIPDVSNLLCQIPLPRTNCRACDLWQLVQRLR